MIGSVFISLLILLGVVQRFVHIAKRKEQSDRFIVPLICGVIVGTYISLTSQPIGDIRFLLVVIGLFQGLFNGALIAALAETLNVFPLLSKRFHLRGHLFSLLVALVLGKVIGSLFQWLILAR
ncbi:MAG TPA: stage V sporulation protein AB [Pseudogracilibacillus sp.]|nr:stage V sporulation protein AB [Pseudogracilibacillus sp.]